MTFVEQAELAENGEFQARVRQAAIFAAVEIMAWVPDNTPQAIEALAIMKQYTKMKKGDVFEHPVLNAPWHDDRSQRDTYWKPSLIRCGIRYHRQYCTRATCATAALMEGVDPSFMATQLGHSIKMFFETYAKWISGKRDKAQVALLAASTAPILGAEKQKASAS